MPCGGIYPSKVPADYVCWWCHLPATDHWVEEWDAPLHKACVAPFLLSEEGQIVIAHNHLIQIGDQVLQEEGRSMMDPEIALQKLREAVRDFKNWRDRELEEKPLPGQVTTNARKKHELIIHSPVDDVIEHFDALDQWLMKGGFLPADWNKNR